MKIGKIRTFISPAALLVIGIVIRLIWILTVHTDQVSDALWYHTAASGLAESGKYTLNNQHTAFFPVGYPAFLAGFYLLFGQAAIVGQLANLLLSAFLLFFSYELARKWFSDKIAWLTLFLLIIYPNHIAYCSLLLNELLFTTLLLGGFWCLEQLPKSYRAWSAGVCWAIACHVKPWLILLPGALAIGNKRYLNWKKLVPIYICVLLFTLPWAYRNAKQLGSWAPYSTNGGINLLIGNNPHATGTYYFEGEVAQLLDTTQTEVEQNQQASSLAISYLIQHPWQSIKRIPSKWYYLFHHGNEGFYWLKMGNSNLPPGIWRVASVSGQLLYLFILVLTLVFILKQLVIRKSSSYNLKTPFIFCMLLLLVYSLFFGYSRYHFPMTPFLVMFACASLFREK